MIGIRITIIITISLSHIYDAASILREFVNCKSDRLISLCAFDATDRWVRGYRTTAGDLPGAVFQELRTAAALIPLLVEHMSAGWDSQACCSDSSNAGFAVVRRTLDSEDFGSWGRQSGRWRCAFGDAIAARKHGLMLAHEHMHEGTARKNIASALDRLSRRCFVGSGSSISSGGVTGGLVAADSTGTCERSKHKATINTLNKYTISGIMFFQNTDLVDVVLLSPCGEGS